MGTFSVTIDATSSFIYGAPKLEILINGVVHTSLVIGAGFSSTMLMLS